MSLEALNKRLDDLGGLIKEEREANDARIKALEEKGFVPPEIQSKLEKMDSRYNDIDKDIDRLEKAIAKAKGPVVAANDGKYSEVQLNHKSSALAWLRDPTNETLKKEMVEAGTAAREEQVKNQKAVTIGDDASGGFAVPEIISQTIHQKIIESSPIYDLVDRVSAGSSDYKELIDIGGEGYGWVGEGDTRTETGTSQLAEIDPTFGTIYAYPKASEESMQDIFFNVEQWLINTSYRGLARGIGVGIIAGNGTKKMTGFLAGTPVATADEDGRDFGVLQYTPTGNATGFGNDQTGDPKGNPGDILMDCNASLKNGHKGNAVWLMNRTTQSRIRKFKNANGDYLFERSLQVGVPSMIDGYAVREMPDMPDIGANAFPIAFGDFKEGYVLVELAGLRVTRDEITTPGYVKFYIRQRLGGCVRNSEAIKLIKCAAA